MKSKLVTASLVLLVCTLPAAQSANKFQKWFHRSYGIFDPISRENCSDTLKAWENAYHRHHGATWIDLGLSNDPIFDLCYDHERCIIQNTPDDINAILQSSAVILGLTPTLLAVLSPSIAEMALLFSHRPLLSTIISLGSPGVLQTRIFEYSDPATILGPPDGGTALRDGRLRLGPWSTKGSWMLSAVQYTSGLLSAINILVLVVELGTKSVINWGCTKSWPPILWAVWPFIIHGLAAVGYKLALYQSYESRKLSLIRARRSGAKFDDEGDRLNSVPTEDFVDYQQPPTKRILENIASVLRRELTPSASHSPTLDLRIPKERQRDVKMTMAVLLNCVAGFLSFMHLFYGTVVFSSLLFIHAIDAIGYVAIRVLISVLICRVIVLVEIAGMRGARASNISAS